MKFPRQPVMPTSFNPRSRAASDGRSVRYGPSPGCFNPRSRAASDASPLRKPPTMAGFQPTLARGERPRAGRNRGQRMAVSTHARARRATVRSRHPSDSPPGFNPRSRAASDESGGTGARAPRGFNPRSRAASDDLIVGGNVQMGPFQPTLARGERRPPEHQALAAEVFQPTLARGERHVSHLFSRLPQIVSTHARARRATISITPICPCLSVSTHARARRATIGITACNVSPNCFNPRSRAASDARSARLAPRR